MHHDEQIICDVTSAITGCENYWYFWRISPRAGANHHLPLLAWYEIWKKKWKTFQTKSLESGSFVQDLGPMTA
jgi:hypothetical protein